MSNHESIFDALSATVSPEWKTRQFQLIGVLPFLIFLWRLIQYISVGTPDWIIYSCHVSTLLLGVGMVVGSAWAIRVSVIWLVIGLPMWIIDAWVTQVVWVASVFSHVGGFILALYAIGKVRAIGSSWLPALLWFVGLQLLTRYTTRPELNINVAHTPYELFKDTYSGYWAFWVVCTLVVALMVWVVEFALARFYPARRG
ncbi:MAG: hypothetical protein ACKVZH_05360 [Blastocatellia bacterium]